MSKKLKVRIGLLLLAVGVLYLIVTGVNSFSSYYLTIEEVYAEAEEFYNQRLKVSGLIVGDSIDWNSQEIKLKFKIKEGEKTEQRIPIKYQGVKPDNFEGGQAVIVEGEFVNGEYIAADELLIQCPSRYEAELKERREEHSDQIEQNF
ncbi:cytochrome c maturation protein CcmE [Natroniella sp. ANB-PHB2]|uniref:cytochrome c maturation protein CcmE n=1 Tax=Natroniella sp. ANB-PHB2 TaxID=3384444 RepID=UPI0038D46A20